MIKTKLPGMVIEASIANEDIRFFVHNPADHIQKFHVQGQFYEKEELALMSQHITADTRYVDVGANIGNHVIYFGKYHHLRNIVAIEPNPLAAALLRFNVLLNELTDVVDLSCLAYGLSDEIGNADLVVPRNNLGASKIMDNSDGKLKLTTGDELMGDRAVDFVKIDTEGMEMKCLRGLDQTIRRCRPTMFVEVNNANSRDFQEWCVAHEYQIAARLRRYVANENFLVTHASRSQAT
jgi:FkbM family methyltransferase